MKKIINNINFKEWSNLDIGLTIAIAFLSGIITGFILSPKGSRAYGCNNGNYYNALGNGDETDNAEESEMSSEEISN